MTIVLGLIVLVGLYRLAVAEARPHTKVFAAQAPPTRNADKRPNVLIILADDLAGDGLRYTQFYNSARCSPSRASLLTGLNPHQAGVPLLGTPLNDQCVTLAEVLKPAGYHTYMVGKWHLSEQSTPVMRGFEEFYGMLGGFNTYWKENPYYTRRSPQARLPARRLLFDECLWGLRAGLHGSGPCIRPALVSVFGV
jgi:hypothetical protein